MTDQNNGANGSEGTEGQNQHGFDLKPILDKLNMHSEVLAKLADAPETVNADGLRHLSEQVKPMLEAIKTLPEQVQSTVKQTVAERENAALEQVNSLKLTLDRREIMSKYGLDRDDEKLFLPYKTAEEIEEAAKAISDRLAAAKPKSFEFSNPGEVKIADHLAHLRK